MEENASGEELVLKARKPYTITKQRERWTEDEHHRFLEALKLYGRAWRKIEEHIGTKTDVQIRSHAQKFFTKLEKEAHAKGVPVGQALDIVIPPPRPKRKPSTPYPRKMCKGTLVSQETGKDGNLETTILQCKTPDGGEGKLLNVKQNQDENCTGGFNVLQDAPCCSSVSSVNKSSAQIVPVANSCTFREFLPLPKEVTDDNGTRKAINLERSSCHMNDKSVTGTERNGCIGISLTDAQATQTNPKHVPVHILDGSSVTCTVSPPNKPSENFRPIGESHIIGNTNAYPSVSAISPDHLKEVPSPNYQTPWTFHPGFLPIPPTQEAFELFSKLVVSSLLQNPAAHAAAAYAASFWPCANQDTNPDDSSRSFTHRQMNSSPSFAAIAASTLAAATSWWATQGLVPLCTPFHTAVTCCPPSSITNTRQNPVAKADPKEPNHQKTSMQDQDALTAYSEESGHESPQTGQKPDCNGEAAAESGICDANGAKNRKQVDRSSCGSNTPSSDVEMDVQENHEKDDEVKEADAGSLPANELSIRRGKSNNNLGVSEGGRLAFQALFSRNTLPQSFSTPQATKNQAKLQENYTESRTQNVNEKDRDVLLLDLNINMQGTFSDQQEEKKNTLRANEDYVEEGLLTIGLGDGRPKARKTGFKPYKRCSVDAKENRVFHTSGNHADERGPKRVRLDGEAPT